MCRLIDAATIVVVTWVLIELAVLALGTRLLFGIALITICILAAWAMRGLAPNLPILSLSGTMFTAICHEFQGPGIRGPSKPVSISVAELRKVWIGKPIEYPNCWLLPVSERTSYYRTETLVFWIHDRPNLFQVRDFVWLDQTDRLLAALAEHGVVIEQVKNASSHA